MTYNVFGGTLNLAQSINLELCADRTIPSCNGNCVPYWKLRWPLYATIAHTLDRCCTGDSSHNRNSGRSCYGLFVVGRPSVSVVVDRY